MKESANINIGLSEEEKRDLETMISEFQMERTASDPVMDMVAVQQQIEAINKRMEYLSNMFLTIDRRLKPLYEIIRMTFEKSELLNQRINALIESIRTGDPLK
ncbi:MAG: hypothetical protein PVG41_20575 [Desulfobacteraceae bacterium]|jgi:hypothetical protein